MKYVLHNKFRMIIFHDQKALSLNFKSSRSQMFFKIYVKNLAMFTGKYLCWSYFLIQLQGCRTAILLERDLTTQVLSCEYCKIFKNTYFEEHLRMAASVLLIIELPIKYWTTANLFLIKNITWNGFYFKGLQICSEYIFADCQQKPFQQGKILFYQDFDRFTQAAVHYVMSPP